LKILDEAIARKKERDMSGENLHENLKNLKFNCKKYKRKLKN